VWRYCQNWLKNRYWIQLTPDRIHRLAALHRYMEFLAKPGLSLHQTTPCCLYRMRWLVRELRQLDRPITCGLTPTAKIRVGQMNGTHRQWALDCWWHVLCLVRISDSRTIRTSLKYQLSEAKTYFMSIAEVHPEMVSEVGHDNSRYFPLYNEYSSFISLFDNKFGYLCNVLK
jgi:hypothetical protein